MAARNRKPADPKAAPGWSFPDIDPPGPAVFDPAPRKLEPLTDEERERLDGLREFPVGMLTADELTEVSGLRAREGVEAAEPEAEGKADD